MYDGFSSSIYYRPRLHPGISLVPFLREFPLDILIYLAPFLPQETLRLYILVCRALTGSVRRWLYTDITLKTSQQAEALKCTLVSDSGLCKYVRTLRLGSISATTCLQDLSLFPRLGEIVFSKKCKWKDDPLGSRLVLKGNQMVLTKITIESLIELDSLVGIISSMDSLTSLSCGELSFNRPCRIEASEIRCTLKSLSIVVGGSKKRKPSMDPWVSG